MLNETMIDEYALCLMISLPCMSYHDEYFENKWNHVWFEVMQNDIMKILDVFDTMIDNFMYEILSYTWW